MTGLGAIRFGCFVLQVSTEGLGDVAGVLENLATGEKQPFASAADLAARLREWSGSTEPGAGWGSIGHAAPTSPTPPERR